MSSSQSSPKLTHLNESGQAAMVDISAKPQQAREAVAEARILLQPSTLVLLRENGLKKGDVLAVARVAGIQAAKQTQMLIPLCHQIALTQVAVDFVFESAGVHIITKAKTVSATGVEMEALTAASVAALTIYDMCKAVDKQMCITDIRLMSKIKQDI